MQVWNLLYAAHWKHRTQKSRQKSQSGHHRTTLSGYIFATEAHIDNRKNLLNSSMSSTCRSCPLTVFCPVQNSLYVQVLRCHILTALLHGTPTAGVSQTLRHGTRSGITELSQMAVQNSAGRSSRWASAHILVAHETTAQVTKNSPAIRHKSQIPLR